MCGVYRDGIERRGSSYVVSFMAYHTAAFPNHLVAAAIEEIDADLARYINQPLYL